MTLATDVIEGEKQVMLMMQISRKPDFDLVVEFRRIVVMKDVGGGGSDEGAVSWGGRVIEGGTGSSVDAAQRRGARFVGIAYLTSDGDITRSRKRFLSVVFEFARVDVDVILIGRKRRHEIEE